MAKTDGEVIFPSIHSSQIRIALENKMCENCEAYFFRNVGESRRYCKRCHPIVPIRGGKLEE